MYFQGSHKMCKKILKASLFTLLVAASSSYAQDTNGLADSIEVCPKNSVLLTENEHTRLIHFKLKSGQKCPMHRTTGGFAYVISGATITLITADGQALSYGPAEHVVEGTRGTFEAIFLENKTSQ
jgi:hypothetical protein